MLSIVHSTTGAFIAAKLQNPFAYIPVIFVSHYIEDWIKHWDVGTGLTAGTRKKRDAFLAELVDLVVTGVLVLIMYPPKFPLNLIQMATYTPYIGAFIALIPDFMEAPRNFFKIDPWFLKPFNTFHHRVHRSIPDKVRGLLPQIAILILLFLFR